MKYEIKGSYISFESVNKVAKCDNSCGTVYYAVYKVRVPTVDRDSVDEIPEYNIIQSVTVTMLSSTFICCYLLVVILQNKIWYFLLF